MHWLISQPNPLYWLVLQKKLLLVVMVWIIFAVTHVQMSMGCRNIVALQYIP